MNRDELIQQLDGIVTKKPKSYYSRYQRNIINESIRALKQGHCEDAVSRKTVVKWLETASDESIEDAIDSNLGFIPSVTITKKDIVEQEKIDLLERAKVLLKATRKLLEKQENSCYVLDLLNQAVFYDGVNCDGHCLKDDIGYWLDELEEQTNCKK